ncbi:MmyB family transcriptional regulator [Streptomyces mexicanus]|uniref:MmyB family transcriptional regulator n=1 Tax=Streptomyces mexicanus TaxID=178566 RepID=UPI001F1760A7|nr:hypothetical protein [Streptomyces mexicanus]
MLLPTPHARISGPVDDGCALVDGARPPPTATSAGALGHRSAMCGRSVYPDWDTVADQQAAALKQGPGRTDVHVGELMDELTVSCGEPFAGRLRTLPGLPRANGVVRMVHPHVGEVRLAYEARELPADDDQHLVVHLPADDASAAALDRLTGRRSGAVRAV